MHPFITFEGGEGTGKTTQTALLAKAFQAKGKTAICTREPGGSKGAESIRDLLVKGDVNRWDAKTELLLHFAARRDHICKTILPALKEGQFILCDRFFDSTTAYQHYGHGIDKALVQFLTDNIVEEIIPALTFIFTLPTSDEGITRATHRGDIENRYERMGSAFHQRVTKGFLAIAKENPERCILIDAGRTIPEIHLQLIDEVNKRFNLTLKPVT